MGTENAAPAEGQKADEEKKEDEKKEDRRVWVLITRAGVVVALLVGIATLYFMFRPAPTPVKSITMPRPELEAGITYAQYLDRVDLGPCELAPDKCTERGASIEFAVEATGYKGEHLRLKWELIDLGSGNEVLESDAFTITPAADTDTVTVPAIFVPFPESGGPFRIRAELFDEADERIGRTRSPVFERGQ